MIVMELEKAKKEIDTRQFLERIPVVERIYIFNGELKFEVSGEKEILNTWNKGIEDFSK
ncbi:hypothetical protein ACQCWI_28195 [Bacillus thuringiensis]|uniref:hypothetical protein n=1 Tax=Bacillus thuringiensis TaxID=1428 RepID=UPI003CE7FAB2